MSRRHAAKERITLPDPKFHNHVVGKFMNTLMYDGKKSAAEEIVYGAFDIIAQKTGKDPIVVFGDALENVGPTVEVRSRRVVLPTKCLPKCVTSVVRRWQFVGSSLPCATAVKKQPVSVWRAKSWMRHRAAATL
jgi:small subunit ribosomal protein S7